MADAESVQVVAGAGFRPVLVVCLLQLDVHSILEALKHVAKADATA